MNGEFNDKKELRRKFSEIRRRAAADDNRNALITERALADERILSADTVLLYASFGSEPDTWRIADVLLGRGVAVAFPRCGKNGVMRFHTVTSTAQLKNSKFGIREPSENLPFPDISGKTVCIVPGLAFTEMGDRLGYGGGFYDRFLAENPQISTVALAFEASVADRLFTEAHDVRVDYIITEERTVICNAE